MSSPNNNELSLVNGPPKIKTFEERREEAKKRREQKAVVATPVQQTSRSWSFWKRSHIPDEEEEEAKVATPPPYSRSYSFPLTTLVVGVILIAFVFIYSNQVVYDACMKGEKEEADRHINSENIACEDVVRYNDRNEREATRTYDKDLALYREEREKMEKLDIQVMEMERRLKTDEDANYTKCITASGRANETRRSTLYWETWSTCVNNREIGKKVDPYARLRRNEEAWTEWLIDTLLLCENIASRIPCRLAKNHPNCTGTSKATFISCSEYEDGILCFGHMEGGDFENSPIRQLDKKNRQLGCEKERLEYREFETENIQKLKDKIKWPEKPEYITPPYRECSRSKYVAGKCELKQFTELERFMWLSAFLICLSVMVTFSSGVSCFGIIWSRGGWPLWSFISWILLLTLVILVFCRKVVEYGITLMPVAQKVYDFVQ